jgi:RNA polymerase sigma factor FliA
MNTILQTSPTLAEHLDIVDAALATVSRRLPLSVARDDLASVGKLALISALGQCPGPGDELRAYCFVRVRGAMLDELRRLDPLTRRRRDQLSAVVKAQTELGGRLGRAPTRVELAAATRLSLTDVGTALAAIAAESEFAETEWDSLPDTETPSPAETLESDDLRLSLRSALERLSSTQACVLYRYYFEEATLDAIATDLGISKERVRQIREAAEKKLRADFVVLAIWQSLVSED